MAAMTEEEITKLAKAAVQETLLMMGVDCSKPEAVTEMQLDFQHVRKWRKSVETVQRQSLITSVIILMTGLIGAALVAFRGH